MVIFKTDTERPVHFLAAGIFMSETAWRHADRVMDSYELIIGVRETVYIREEEVLYEVGPGDVLILSPERRHAGFDHSPAGVTFFWFHFELGDRVALLSEDEMKREAEEIGSNMPRSWSVHSLYLPKFMHVGQNDRMNVLANQILHIANSNYLTYQSVNYPFTSLLIEISEQVMSKHGVRGGSASGDVQFAKIAEWTRIHAASPLTVAGIAAKFNYNKDYLSRLFRQYVSMGPMEYIREIRIGKAKELLTRTTLSVKEVAAEVGFLDDKHFMRVFKRCVNMTPKQFRNAYHKTFLNND